MRISIRLLKTLTIIYLILPVMVFFLAWVKLYIGVPIVCMVLAGFKYYLGHLKKHENQSFSFPTIQLLALFLLVVLWVSFTGIGGLGIKLHDHLKIYAIFNDIISYRWPVEYNYAGQKYFLSSYLGYHITAPVLFGWISYNAANLFLFASTCFAVFISILWFGVLCNSKSIILPFLFFVLVGGMDIIGFLYQNGLDFSSVPWAQLYWWNSIKIDDYLVYHGNSNLLIWAGPHAMSAWVVSGIFFYDLLKSKNLSLSPIYLCPVVFWSPFVLVGLFPFFLMQLLKQGIKEFMSFSNFIIIPAFILLSWFVLSVEATEIEMGFLLFPVSSKLDFLKTVFYWLWFFMAEVGIWSLFVFLVLRKTKNWLKVSYWFWIMVATLLLIPLYRYGKYNDWVQRVSLPSLFLLWVFLVQSFAQLKTVRYKLIGFLLLIISSADSLGWLKLSFEAAGRGSFYFSPVPRSDLQSFPEVSEQQGWPLEQVLAPEDASFFKYIAK